MALVESVLASPTAPKLRTSKVLPSDKAAPTFPCAPHPQTAPNKSGAARKHFRAETRARVPAFRPIIGYQCPNLSCAFGSRFGPAPSGWFLSNFRLRSARQRKIITRIGEADIADHRPKQSF